MNQQGEWALAKSDSEFTLGVAVVERINADNFNVIFNGLIYNLPLELSRVGEYYFVSDTVAGTLTPTEPTNPSSFSNPLLFLTFPRTGIVLNLRPETLSLPDVKFDTQAIYPLQVDATTISLNPNNSAHGDLLFRNATGWERLPAGSPGQILVSNGTGSDPSWVYSSYQNLLPIQVGRDVTNYSANTNYYIGSIRGGGNNLMQNANIQKIKSPVNGRVVKINHIICSESGSTELCTFKIKNFTKDTFSQSWSLSLNPTLGSNSIIDLNLQVNQGDDLALIMQTPSSWVSAPTQTQQSCIIYFEPSVEGSNYLPY